MTSLPGHPADIMQRSPDESSTTRLAHAVTMPPVTLPLRLQSCSMCLLSARLCLLLWQLSKPRCSWAIASLVHASHITELSFVVLSHAQTTSNLLVASGFMLKRLYCKLLTPANQIYQLVPVHSSARKLQSLVRGHVST